MPACALVIAVVLAACTNSPRQNPDHDPATVTASTSPPAKPGTIVITPQFLDAGDFVGGVARVRIGDALTGKWGWIDTHGTFVIPAQFDEAYAFTEGLAAVRVNEVWGYINKGGTFAITPQFASAWKFSEGLAPVRIGDGKTGRWGYIDKQGLL
jgi:hypothetical protein